MHILYDTQIRLDANVEEVWDALISIEQRQKWQSNISSAELISGSAGYRGAQTKLTLQDSGEVIIEQVQRSRPLERLQTQFKLGDCSYQQIVYLTRLDESRTQLTYHCKQALSSGWRRIINIRPSAPACVKPDIYESLSRILEQDVTSA